MSKHPRMLRDIALVRVRTDSRQRLCRPHAGAPRPLRGLVKAYEGLWSERLDRVMRSWRSARGR